MIGALKVGLELMRKNRKTVQPNNITGKCKGTQNRNGQEIVRCLENLEHRILHGKAGWYK